MLQNRTLAFAMENERVEEPRLVEMAIETLVLCNVGVYLKKIFGLVCRSIWRGGIEVLVNEVVFGAAETQCL